ncbi:MAG: cell division protein FtsZ, partial [Flavobacteriales bacterium]
MEHTNFEMMRFDLPKDQSSIIKVIGVGGGGSNAVNYMYEQGINGVDFIVCNTDAQALDKSPVPTKIQLGATLTEGRGAGSIPEVGRNAAVENLDDVKEILGKGTTMVFITAGMGGGTGTGAAPVIAKAAKEMGILTVGIVTVPFLFEGRRRSHQASSGLEEMREAVDTLLVIRNDKLRELYGNLSLKKAFDHADEVLCTAAKGIAEVITLTGEINVDMNDVNTVLRDSGVAIMGSGHASGEGRAMAAVTTALESPLLNDNDITGANFILLNITYGTDEVLMDEIMEITDHIQEKAGMSAEVIWGYGPDETLEEDLCVTVIATGFQANSIDAGLNKQAPKTTKLWLGDQSAKEVVAPVNKPTETNAPVNKAPLSFETNEEPEMYIKPAEPAEPEVTNNQDIDTNYSSTEEKTIVHELNEEQPELFKLDTEAELNIEEPSEKEEPVEINKMKFQEVETTPATDKPIYFNLGEEEENTDFESQISDEVTDKLSFNDQIDTTEEIVEDRPSRTELVSRNKDREQRIRELTGSKQALLAS